MKKSILILILAGLLTSCMPVENSQESSEISTAQEVTEASESEEISESEAFRKPQLPYFADEIQKLKDQECDILLFTPGGCTGCLRSLPTESLRNVWNTRFTDYALSQGKLKPIAEEILQKFPEKRPLYLLETEVLRFMGTDLKKVADYLNKAGKETYYIAERR